MLSSETRQLTTYKQGKKNSVEVIQIVFALLRKPNSIENSTLQRSGLFRFLFWGYRQI